jgi:hypothetical protein
MNRFLTSSQRAMNRGGRALALLFCACLVLAASCSKDYKNCPDCPGTPALIPGTFVLAAVDGKLLPYNPPNQTVTILSGDCVTTSAEKFTLNITTTNGKDTTTAKSEGVVLPYNGQTVTFHFTPSDVQSQALITGNGFELTFNSLTMLFERTGP